MVLSQAFHFIFFFYSVGVFHTSSSWWLLIGVQMTASILRFLQSFFADLCNVLVWMVAIHAVSFPVLLEYFFIYYHRHLHVPYFFIYLAKFKYLFNFSPPWNPQDTFFSSLTKTTFSLLAFLGDSFVCTNPRELYTFQFLGHILVSEYTSFTIVKFHFFWN